MILVDRSIKYLELHKITQPLSFIFFVIEHKCFSYGSQSEQVMFQIVENWIWFLTFLPMKLGHGSFHVQYSFNYCIPLNVFLL